MRRSIFFLLFLLFPSVVSAVGIKSADGTRCYFVTYNDTQSWTGTHAYKLWYTSSNPAYQITGSPLLLRGDQDSTSTGRIGGYLYGLTFYYWNGSSWVGTSAGTGSYSGQFVTQEILDYFYSFVQSVGAVKNSERPTSPPLGFCEDSCDISDSDGDGVCNECDLAPGQPDQDDCLLIENIDKVTGQLVAVTINRQCDGQTHEYWESENYNPLTARALANIGASAEKLGKQNCQAGLPAGQCCAYGPGSPGETYTASLAPQPSVPATNEEIINSLLDLPSLDDIPDKCANHNATCKQYCEDKLGVAMSYCRDGDNGKKVSDCKCNNDFAYSMASPDESTQEKVDQVDQAINKDSNSNGVPDYADAGTQNKADTDSDGIHDQADVDQTGGIDANGDGIDDKATAEAHANAVASSGLSEADSRNLDAIEQSTAQTASGVEGLKTSMDQVVSKADDLLDAADSALAESQAIREHLDTFTEDNTGSLSTIEQTLNDGPFSGLSEGDIPDDPASEENFDVDSFVQEFSFAFPDTMKGLIEDSKIETTSSDSCIRGTVMGQQIEFCFNQFHSIFVAMGVLFQGLCVFRAFGIVVGGFGR